jgi:integrase
MAQGKRERARDSRGRPVPGLYVRDGRFIAGFKLDGRWLMVTLAASTLTEARRERERLLSELRERRRPAPDRSTFAEVFADWQAARTIGERTRAYEREFVTRYLADLYRRPVQELRPADVARVLRRMRDDGYAPLTRRHVYVLARGTLQHAVRRGLLLQNPCDGLAPQEVPTGAAKRPVAVLDRAELARLVAAGSSERWRAALGLAAFAGLRLGELRALRWADVDLKRRLLHVRASADRQGALRSPKTKAGERAVPILPELRRLLVELRLRSPRSRADDFVIGSASGRPVEERTLARVLADAKTRAGLDAGEERLSWHSLRHSFCSMLATELELPATTLARIVGHADPGFSLRVYAKDARDDAALAAEVLARASHQG